jgi:succinate dehydrogenase / fumarate reductase cytochrome b subunit
MSALRQFFSSTIGTKFLIALTGLGFAAFLVEHMVANLLVLYDPQGYNAYSHRLLSNPLIYVAEAGLVLLFVTHVYKAIANYAANRGARPQTYAVKKNAGHTSRKTLASTLMIVSGLWLLLFIVIHLKTFKFGPWYETDTGMRDLAKLVNEDFRKPLITTFYVISMAIVALHLRHGLSSGLQSLGINHPKYTPMLLKAGVVIAVAIGLGFAIVPIVIFVTGGRS